MINYLGVCEHRGSLLGGPFKGILLCLGYSTGFPTLGQYPLVKDMDWLNHLLPFTSSTAFGHARTHSSFPWLDLLLGVHIRGPLFLEVGLKGQDRMQVQEALLVFLLPQIPNLFLI